MNTKSQNQSPAKALTEAEKLQARIERYEAQAAENKAKADKLKAKISEENRKIETRKKIIMGAALQSYLAKATPAEHDILLNKLVKHVSKKDGEFVGWLETVLNPF